MHVDRANIGYIFCGGVKIMTKFIPSLFSIPPRGLRNIPLGQPVTVTMPGKSFRTILSALEAAGMAVTRKDGIVTVMSASQEILRASKGNRGTYLVRYAQGATDFAEKFK